MNSRVYRWIKHYYSLQTFWHICLQHRQYNKLYICLHIHYIVVVGGEIHEIFLAKYFKISSDNILCISVISVTFYYSFFCIQRKVDIRPLEMQYWKAAKQSKLTTKVGYRRRKWKWGKSERQIEPKSEKKKELIKGTTLVYE